MDNLEFHNYKCKPYLHIDKRISINKVKNYITEPKKIANHSFLPFLRYDKYFYKYVGYGKGEIENRPVKIKTRSLMYAGHLDSYIYKYYSELLNQSYNIWMNKEGLDKYSVAYRSNRQHQSSINFAAQAISFLEKKDNVIVIIGDFEKFFDTLDHRLLKERLQKVLLVERLPNDWYNIFKSLTKFAFIDKEKLEISDNPLVQKNNISYFHSIADFRKYHKYNKCNLNKTASGIPQGNTLSGVLANVYAIDFDSELSNLSKCYNGMYQRYSDDFILVLNVELLEDVFGNNYIEHIITYIQRLAADNKITLQREKNKLYYVRDKTVLDSDRGKSHIDYLGFSFDGQNVRIREKSIYKFYRNARRLIKSAKKIQKEKGLPNLPNRHKLYSLYTDFGRSERYPSNFINYVKRSQHIFDRISPSTNNLMLSQLKNRKKKIESALGYRIHSQIEKGIDR